jgi:hypothetical protein
VRREGEPFCKGLSRPMLASVSNALFSGADAF